MPCFTVQIPSRSSTKYLGTQDPLALSPQIAPRAAAQMSHSCHRGSDIKVLRLPMTMRPIRARVSMTLRRRQSQRKPTLPSRLFLTAQKMMTSFSWPWNLSTDSTSRPDRNFCRPGRSLISFFKSLTWPLYGVTMPTSSGPILPFFVTSSRAHIVFSASAGLMYEEPWPSRFSSHFSRLMKATGMCLWGQGKPSGGFRWM
mmetsp:Transcript_76293/g.182569  ORF Transcript_76293/g.182569 Transcript_76293/m.182569 type:complete len:200 (+) Transcript_76293:103-702(+)